MVSRYRRDPGKPTSYHPCNASGRIESVQRIPPCRAAREKLFPRDVLTSTRRIGADGVGTYGLMWYSFHLTKLHKYTGMMRCTTLVDHPTVQYGRVAEEGLVVKYIRFLIPNPATYGIVCFAFTRCRSRRSRVSRGIEHWNTGGQMHSVQCCRFSSLTVS